MSGGKRQNISGFERKRAKQAERKRPHIDKYADSANRTPEEQEDTDERG